MTTVLQIEYVGDLAPYDLERSALAAAGVELQVLRPDEHDRLPERAREADVIWLEWTPALTGDLLRELPRCQLILRWGVGYDQIDVATAGELGIAVGNCPTYCTQDVAEHTLALMLSVTRQVPSRARQMATGQWRPGRLRTRRLAASTVGVIGLGRIGASVARRVQAFGATVLGCDVLDRTVPGVEPVTLPELLARSDIVTLHIPMSVRNHRFFGAAELAAMRPGAILINTSRGGVVDQEAVHQSLESGRLAGAGLDVFDVEPLPADDPIRTAPGTVLTPHDAAFSPDSLLDLRREMTDTTISWLTTGWAPSIVNPEVAGRTRWPATTGDPDA